MRLQEDAPDPELLRALGDVVVRHSALEESLRDALWLETKTDKVVVHVLLSGLNCSTLIDKFGAVYYENHPPRRGQVSDLCAHLRQLTDLRNSLIHSFWTTVAGSPDAVRLKLSATAKHGLVVRSHGVSAAAVQELARDLAGATDKVWELITDLSFGPP